ncbi:MAG TPA: hypothetical protein VNG51_30110 [Ktedonobacteraceae bacterium]|nr:hypothetical protein [Ktedonobacteraceae bacterium]
MKIKDLIEELLAAEELAEQQALEEDRGFAEGYQKGFIERKLHTARNILVIIVSWHYPDLRDMANQGATGIKHFEVLCELIGLLSVAPSEEMVRFILTSPLAA